MILGLTVINETYRAERHSYKLDLAIDDIYSIELFSFPNPPERPSRPEATGLRHLAFEVDKLRVSLFLIAFSNLLKGNFSTAGNRFILALKKCRGGNLKKNAPKILYDKVYSTLKKV